MMHCFNMDQQKLYQQYSELSKNVFCNFSFDYKRKLQNTYILDLFSNYGLWKLPIANKHGGHGLSWQDFVAALYGIFNYDIMSELTPLLISHISVLYLISRYAIESIKQKYLPRLIKGEMGHFFIPKTMDFLLGNLKLDNKNNSINFDNKIFIYLENENNDISFYISESNACSIFEKVNFSKKSLRFSEKEFVEKNINQLVLCDLINFIRLVYGALSRKHISKIKITNKMYNFN